MEKKECKHAHCKCMNLGGQCSNFHYADCNKEFIEWEKQKNKFTVSELAAWNGYEMDHFIDVLNGDLSLEEARENLLSFRGSEFYTSDKD